MQPQVFQLFPAPMMHVPGVIDSAQASGIAVHLDAGAPIGNPRSAALTHSRLLGPGEHPGVDHVVEAVGPHVQAMGELLLGEQLRWRVKEIWGNVLEPGGQQGLHNHANSFVSGVLYLTPSDPSARTVFLRGIGAGEFVFRNTHERMTPGPFNADKWVAPQCAPGDLLLFPSWMLHEVPANRGGRRATLAFNAIPERLDAWGYTVSLQP